MAKDIKQIWREKGRIRVAIYSRKSKFTGKGESVQNQVNQCKEYISRNYQDIEIEFCEFVDDGYSGGNTKRPKYEEMMQKEKNKNTRFDAVVTYKLDRISRNTVDFNNFSNKLKEYDTEFISVTEEFNTTNSMGCAMMQISSVFAELERNMISERIKMNMYQLSKNGNWLGGNTPTGYSSERISFERDGKTYFQYKLVVNNDEAYIVKSIFNTYLETGSLTKTMKSLSQRKILSKNGKNILIRALKDIISNPVYCPCSKEVYEFYKSRNCEVCFSEESCDESKGIMPYNRHPHKNNKQKAASYNEWTIAMGSHEPIVTAENFIKANIMLENLKPDSPYSNVHNPSSLLSGILYCSSGHIMRPKKNGTPHKDGTYYTAYRCKYKDIAGAKSCNSKNIDMDLLDNEVLNWVFEYDNEDSLINQQLKKLKSSLCSNEEYLEKQITKLKKEISKKDKVISQTYDTYIQTDRSSPVYKDLFSRYEKELNDKNNLNENLDKLIALLKQKNIEDENYDCLVKKLSELKNNYNLMNIVTKRNMIASIFEKIIVQDDGTVEVYLKEYVPETKTVNDTLFPLDTDSK